MKVLSVVIAGLISLGLVSSSFAQTMPSAPVTTNTEKPEVKKAADSKVDGTIKPKKAHKKSTGKKTSTKKSHKKPATKKPADSSKMKADAPDSTAAVSANKSM